MDTPKELPFVSTDLLGGMLQESYACFSKKRVAATEEVTGRSRTAKF